MKLNRGHAKFAVKLILGGCLLYYVLTSGMIDFSRLGQMLTNPVNLFVSLAFLTFSAFCCAARWYLLVRAQGLSLSYKNLLELTMLGNFFNTFMPGSVGGDLIKAWYVAGEEPQRKTKAIFTVLLDRIIGLSVIVFYAATTLLFYTSWLKGRHELKALAISLWTFSAVSITLGCLFFLSKGRPGGVTERILGWSARFGKVHTILEAVLLYRRHLPTIIAAVALSGGSIFGTIILYSIQGSSVGITIDLAHYFFVIPVGITVSAIPLLPGGLGVGQVAFSKLFQWTGAEPEQGATLCTLLQFYTLLFNCCGAIFYLKYKKKPLRPATTKDTQPVMPRKKTVGST